VPDIEKLMVRAISDDTRFATMRRSVKYVDYVLGKHALTVVDEWSKALMEPETDKLLLFLQKYAGETQRLFLLVARIASCIFAWRMASVLDLQSFMTFLAG
jgi:hypothetical protein